MVNAREWGAVVAYIIGVCGPERVTSLLVMVPLESAELELSQTGQEICPSLLGGLVVAVGKALQLICDGRIFITGDQLMQLPH